MTEIEARLKAAFDTQATGVRARATVREEFDRRLRRSRRRRQSATAATLVVAGVTACVGIAAARDHDGSDTSKAVPLSVGLRGLPGWGSTVTIKGRLPGGGAFRPETVGADGTVLGRTADSSVWRAGPRGGTPVALGVRSAGGLGAGPGFVTWIDQGTGSLQLECRTSDGRTRVISPQGADPNGPVWVNGETVIFQDVMHQPYYAKGCFTTGRWVTGFGEMVAASFPLLFTVDAGEDHGLQMVNAASTRMVTKLSLPPGVEAPVEVPYHSTQKSELLKRLADATRKTSGIRPSARSSAVATEYMVQPRLWSAGAGTGVFAWANKGVLRIAHQGSWRNTNVLPAKLPKPTKEGAVKVSVGNRFVAFSMQSKSVIYDMQTHRTMTSNGMTYTAGGWLLWQDGNDYRLMEVTG